MDAKCNEKKIVVDGKTYVPEDSIQMGNVSIKQTGYVSHFVNCPKANEFSKKVK